jgi:hypothetical protein
MSNEDYGKILRDFTLTLDKFRKGKKEKVNGATIVYDINNDNAIIKLLSAMSEMYRYQIHEYLVPQESVSGEKQIRQYVKDIICDILPIVETKIRVISQKLGTLGRMSPTKRAERQDEIKSLEENRKKYLVLLDDFYALASFRSLKHFALYMEFDKPDSQKVWKHAMNCFESFFFYANSMILDGKVKRITKSFPVGYGKSYSDSITISFIFGYDINNDALKVVGNNKLIVDTLTAVTGMMINSRYAKVFPYYAQFNGNKELMFDIGKASEGILLIHGSLRPKSLLVVAKDTAVDGARAKFRFYDDITRSKDKENVPEHEKDWAKYSDQWSKRKYDDALDFEIAGGTRYHTEDFLSRYREHHGEEQAVPDKKFKYTMINEKTKFVIISVPKLDFDTDESTYPQKFSTESARLERNRDPRTFAAMEQQQPETPLNSPFYWDNLQTYTSLPLKKCEGGNREDTCLASLDLPRTGANNISLGIYSKCENLYYLIDTYYEKKPLDYIMPDGRTELDWVCDMLIKHNVTELVVEINTCSDIKRQISEKLLARGYPNCKIIEKYSVEKKEVKIMTCWTPIINTIVFPARKVFSLSSMTGRFMQDIIAWNDKAKIDDSIDSVCMFVQEFITKNSMSVGKVSTFKR